MEKSFKAVIDDSKSALILLPNEPSFDLVAASLALYLSLEGKKEISVSCPTPMRVEFNRLVGVNKISEEVGNKNMVLKLVDYPADDIERVSYDLENQQFRLTIIPKPNAEPPKKSQLKIHYSGVSAEMAILMGGHELADFPSLVANELSETRLVHVGIEDLPSPQGRNMISFAKPASSVSEIMADYIKELEGGFHPDIASNLLAGIHEGSKNFTESGVGPNTFRLASELMKAGGRYEQQKPQPPLKFPGMPSMMQMPQFSRPATKGIPMDSPEEEAGEVPMGESVNPPKSWLQPKIYSGSNKGTSVS